MIKLASGETIVSGYCDQRWHYALTSYGNIWKFNVDWRSGESWVRINQNHYTV